jgi:glucosamine--fructose-6-phosphate aminotransferase (isomerizing)
MVIKYCRFVNAEGMPAGEMRHGTLALIEKGTPVITICPYDHTFDETLTSVAETRARGACVIGIPDRENKFFDE